MVRTIQKLKETGIRPTKTRAVIIELLARTDHALSAPELLKELHRYHLKVNKTTVYREIDFLLEQKIVRTIQLSAKRTSYELTAKGHHHHLVCIKCSSVTEVNHGEMEAVLQKLEQKLARTSHFMCIEHNLEFQGVCSKCR